MDIFLMKLTWIFCKDFCTLFEGVVVHNMKSTASECTRAKNIKRLQTERKHADFLEIFQISITKIHAGQRGWFATSSPASGQTLLISDFFSVVLWRRLVAYPAQPSLIIICTQRSPLLYIHGLSSQALRSLKRAKLIILIDSEEYSCIYSQNHKCICFVVM
jgi:hypothetical protein